MIIISLKGIKSIVPCTIAEIPLRKQFLPCQNHDLIPGFYSQFIWNETFVSPVWHSNKNIVRPPWPHPSISKLICFCGTLLIVGLLRRRTFLGIYMWRQIVNTLVEWNRAITHFSFRGSWIDIVLVETRTNYWEKHG